jgi:hypothetical protein
MMEDLLAKLKESPPETEEELRAMLSETGYDLVMTQPEEAPPEEAPPEEPPTEEPPSEEPPAEGEEPDEGMPPGLEALMPVGAKSPKEKTPGMKISILRLKAAGKALKGDKK